MRLRKAERIAAMAVLTAAAAVAGAGIRLAKRHTAYLMKRAAAKFKDDGTDFPPEEIQDGEPAQTAKEPDHSEPAQTEEEPDGTGAAEQAE